MSSVKLVVGSRTVKLRVTVTGAPADRTKSSGDRAVKVPPKAAVALNRAKKSTAPKNEKELLCVPLEKKDRAILFRSSLIRRAFAHAYNAALSSKSCVRHLAPSSQSSKRN